MPVEPNDLMDQSHLHVRERTITTKDFTGNAALDTGGDTTESEKDGVQCRPFALLPSSVSLSGRNGTCDPKIAGIIQEVKTDLKISGNANETQNICTSFNITQHADSLASNFHQELILQNSPVESSCRSHNLTALRLNPGAEQLHSDSIVPLSERNGELSRTHQRASLDRDFYGSVESIVDCIRSWNFRNLTMGSQSCVFPNDFKDEGYRQPVEKSTRYKKITTDQCSDDSATGVKADSSWRFEAGTSFQIRSSHLLRLVCVLMVVSAIIAVIFNGRIRELEEEKSAIRRDLAEVKMHLELLVQQMDTDVSLTAPLERTKRNQPLSNTQESISTSEKEMGTSYNQKDFTGVGQPHRGLVKRSASDRMTKELQYQSPSISFNSLSNDTASVKPNGVVNDWTTEANSNGRKSKLSKGINERRENFVSKKFIRRLLRKELNDLKTAHRIAIAKLKHKLSLHQQRLDSSSLTNFSCCYEGVSHQHNLSYIPANDVHGKKSTALAAYLQIDGSSVNIRKPKQLIGPWFLPDAENDIGFNGMWYNNLRLDSNGTSVVFQEDGLFLIYSQVFYQLQHFHNLKPSPMGYRIYLKKNRNGSHSNRRPMAIAECVPSFPSTVYQTCFTQVAWFIEANDEVYLEHFTDSMPMIEALRNGQTFLGIVRLS